MRCKNCGWENESGRVKCEKCNAPLSGSMIDQSRLSSERAAAPSRSDMDENLMATVRDSSYFNNIQESSNNNTPQRQSHAESSIKICKNCGYEIAPGMRTCPACGFSADHAERVEEERPQFEPGMSVQPKCPKCGAGLTARARFCSNCGHTLRMGTVNAWDNPYETNYCTLRPIAWLKENREYTPMTYSGEAIALNRANTDPNNDTITSKVQAILTREGDNWYIEDKSESKTTMLRISKKTRLESGDIIALGNRLFEFKC